MFRINCRFRRVAFAITLLMLTTMTPAAIDAGAQPASPVAADDLYAAVTEAERGAIEQATAGMLSTYRINAEVDWPGQQISGVVDLDYVNTTGSNVTELPFRLYANDPIYEGAGIELDDIQIAGKTAPIELSVTDTLATFPLAEPLAPNASVEVSIPFRATLPLSELGYGMFGVTPSTGTWTLAGWYPSLAGFDPANGWNLDPLSKYGDPIFTTVSLYDVTLTTPTDLRIVATGEETATTTTGSDSVEHRFVSGPVRDFMIVLDDNFTAIATDVGDTTVRSWYNPETADGAEIAMYTAAQSLRLYSELFGAYPYEDLDVVQTNIGGGAGGVEFPGLVLIGQGAYDEQTNGNDGMQSDILEFTVAHEVAHQWWYGLVGNNQYQHAFLDESLANYSTVLYFEETYGAERGAYELDVNVLFPYLFIMLGGVDSVIDQPSADFPSFNDYGGVIYGKGAYAFGVIRAEIGDDAFFNGLQAYVSANRFGIGQPTALLDAFEHASGEDLDSLWTHWFEEANGPTDFSDEDMNRIADEMQAAALAASPIASPIATPAP